MNDADKPFFKDPEEPKEDDLMDWILVFYQAWEREFFNASGNLNILISNVSIKEDLKKVRLTAETVRDRLANIVLKERKK